MHPCFVAFGANPGNKVVEGGDTSRLDCLCLSRFTVKQNFRHHGLGRIGMGLLLCWRYVHPEFDRMTSIEAMATKSPKFYKALGFSKCDSSRNMMKALRKEDYESL